MIIYERYKLPASDAGCGSICIICNSVELSIKYEFISEIDDRNYIGQIEFTNVSAHRFRQEMLSTGFAPGSYDSIVEIRGSEWLKELMAIESGQIGSSVKDSKHFALFLSNNGYLEVIAESFDVLPEKAGLLNK